MMNSLLTGFTDNTVTQVDGLVVKTGKTVQAEYEWYQAYKDKSDIPYVMGVKDGSIVMKFIERSGEIDMQDVHDMVYKYSRYPQMNNIQFDVYIDRIKGHLQNNKDITNGEHLIKALKDNHPWPTFSHGDLSIYNIIPSTDGLKLIDPLYSRYMFGSYLLDFAKLLFSLKFYSQDLKKYNELENRIPFYMDVLVASECVRVATYKKQFSFIAENLINEL